jgi:hypothetical protein
VAGNSHNLAGANQLARVLITHILLTNMYAITIGFGGEIGSIVEDKCDISALDDRAEYVTNTSNIVVIGTFEAQLHASDIAGVKRFSQTD